MALVTTFVLARLLGPTAFGVAALAILYVLFVKMLLNQGLPAAIIQRHDLDPRHLDSAFWLGLAASGALTLVSVALAGWWSSVNDAPQLRGVVIALSVLIPIQALALVQEAVVRRAMDFKSLALRSNVSTVVGGIAAVAAAVAGAGVWALVVQQVVTEVLGLAFLWRLSPWRPSRRYSSAHARELLRFSTGSFLATVGVFVNNRADTLLVGLFFGPAVVGLYRLAARLVETAVDLTVRALQAVMLPFLSRLQHDHDQLGRQTVRVVHASAVIAFPPLALLAVSSGTVTAVLGPEWRQASIPITVLCIAGAMRALSLFIAPVLQAVGRPHLFAAFTWTSAAASAATLLVAGTLAPSQGPRDQLVAMASSRVAVHLMVAVASVVIVRRILGVSAARFGRSLLPPFAAALALAAVASGAGPMLGSLPPLAELAGRSVAGMAAFGFVILTLDHDVRAGASRTIRRLRGRPPGGQEPTVPNATEAPPISGTLGPDPIDPRRTTSASI